ncbi:hypothetical protein PLEOSDRAFT_1027583, partial [Pleurotus ostreatus PC15]
VLICHVLVLIMHLTCKLPRRSTGVLLAGLRSVVATTLTACNGSEADLQMILQGLPQDPRTVISAFDIDPRFDSYVMCPTCYHLLPDQRPYPESCRFQDTPSDPVCGANLLDKQRIGGKVICRPVRKYLQQDMKHWMARLLSRPGIEEIMDNAPHVGDGGGKMKDIWDSPVMKNFMGHDGRRFFLADGNQGRYAFGLCLDGFNPSGQTTAKNVASSTGIYMVCLNLPPQMRFKPENMFLVGVIPGPGKPSLHQLNHFLRLLVDVLLVFWNPGVYFSRTAKYANGRLVLLALIPVICDSLAARQVSGFHAITSAFFCTCCYLIMDHISNFDKVTWPQRELSHHLRVATQWRDAGSTKDREDILMRTGIRWSELLRLPYWNPILYTVVDSMHNLYLGLYQAHCREIWGMGITNQDGDATEDHHAPPPMPSAEAMERGRQLVTRGSWLELSSCRAEVLHYLCQERGINVNRLRHKKPRAKALIEQHQCPNQQVLTADPGGSTSVPSGPTSKTNKGKKGRKAVLGRTILTAAHEDMEHIELPSWVTAAPSGFGSAGRGKLTADQWRTVCSINLPITLIRLWGDQNSPSEREKAMLENFMDLVSAVEIGSLLAIDAAQIQAYNDRILRYLDTIKDLYPHFRLRPNFHLAAHVGDFLELFDPVHSYRTFGAERYNHVLQGINTSRKHGEIEMTYLTTASRVANLHGILSDYGPAVEPGLLSAYSKFMNYDGRGTRIYDSVSLQPSIQEAVGDPGSKKNEIRMTPQVFNAFISRLNAESENTRYVPALHPKKQHQLGLGDRVVRCTKVMVRGVRFQPLSSLSRNCHIIFRLDQNAQEERPGRVQEILIHKRRFTAGGPLIEETFLVIQVYSSLLGVDISKDDYRKYPMAGSLYYAHFETNVVVIRPQDIVCHFA